MMAHKVTWSRLADPIAFDHVDGVPWYKRPVPHRWHRCKPTTYGWKSFTQIERCACGGFREVEFGKWGVWKWRNSRKR